VSKKIKIPDTLQELETIWNKPVSFSGPEEIHHLMEQNGVELECVFHRDGDVIKVYDPKTGKSTIIGHAPKLPNGKSWQTFQKVKVSLKRKIQSHTKGTKGIAMLLPDNTVLLMDSLERAILDKAKIGKDFEF
jgi:hypothetical protein